MFKKILIANRGEIALRVIRACREMGIATVAVYSKADENALHVRFADQAVCIGPATATDSYLHQPAILSAADITEVDAVHPGYGFLAENRQFAKAVTTLGKVFIGPEVRHLHMFGDKMLAKAEARKAKLPLIPGSPAAVQTLEDALVVAQQIGFPMMLKAAAGGGGKGMRVIEDEGQIIAAFELAQAEAKAAFGSAEVFLERFLPTPRHVEVQVAGDGKGGALHFGTRDCSMQRRHQKIIEEAPAPNLSKKVRAGLQKAAVDIVKSVKYLSVGTVEFLVQGDEFFFLEVNPRIQVEHPVSEQVCGVDLIQIQIRLAAGEGLPMSQKDVKVRGHAIEVRVNAEHPRTFLPSPGVITGYHEPGGLGVRVDSAVHENAIVQPYYDSLMAKLITWGDNREQAIARMRWAIDEFVVEGIETTLPLQKELLASDAFAEVSFHTSFVDSWLAATAEADS